MSWRKGKKRSEQTVYSADEWKNKMAKRHAGKSPAGSTGELTKTILRWLNLNGFKAWRNNTTGVWDAKKKVFRKHHGLLGVSDILGYQKGTARFIAVEVKFGKDKLSDDQILFLDEAKKGGAFAIAAYSFADFLLKIEEYLKEE